MASVRVILVMTLLIAPAFTTRHKNTEIKLVHIRADSQSTIRTEAKEHSDEERTGKKGGSVLFTDKQGYDKETSSEDSIAALKTKDLESSDSHDSKGDFASAPNEQVAEVVSMAIKTAKEADNLSKLDEARKGAHGDSVKKAQFMVSTYNTIMRPILSDKGFKVNILEFLAKVHHVADTYARFIEGLLEVDEILGLWVVSEHKDVRPNVEPNAEVKKPFREATAEQVGEVLRKAIQRAKDVENLSTLEVAYSESESNHDSIKSAKRMVSIYKSIVRPILSSANEPRSLSEGQNNHKDDHDDSTKLAHVMVSIYNFIVPPILSQMGFEEVPTLEFLDEIHRVAEVYARFIDDVVEIDKFMDLGIVHRVEHSHSELKLLREATPEQVEEILTMAIQRAEQPDNLSRLKEAGSKAHADFVKTVQLIAPLFDDILRPILSEKGFEDESILEFLGDVNQFQVDKKLDMHIAELARVLSMEETDAILGMAFHMSKELDKLSTLGKIAKDPVQQNASLEQGTVNHDASPE